MTDEEKTSLQKKKASYLLNIRLVKQQLDKVTMIRDGFLQTYNELRKEFNRLNIGWC